MFHRVLHFLNSIEISQSSIDIRLPEGWHVRFNKPWRKWYQPAPVQTWIVGNLHIDSGFSAAEPYRWCFTKSCTSWCECGEYSHKKLTCPHHPWSLFCNPGLNNGTSFQEKADDPPLFCEKNGTFFFSLLYVEKHMFLVLQKTGEGSSDPLKVPSFYLYGI